MSTEVMHAEVVIQKGPVAGPPISNRRPWTFNRVVELVGRYLVYAIVVFVFLMPFVWMFLGSVRDESEIHGYMFPLSWHTFVPVNWTLQNFLDRSEEHTSELQSRFG